MSKKICMSCNNVTVEAKLKGNGWIELLLWLAYILPGLIYSIWRRSGDPSCCPTCNKENLKPYVESTEEDMVDCEWCAEPIKPKAKICKHCGKDVIPVEKKNAWYDEEDNSDTTSFMNTSSTTSDEMKATDDMESAWTKSTK